MSTAITFLSTSGVTPGAGHDTVSFLINGNILIDTGWYSAIRMLNYGFTPLDLEYLILTHCHPDHYIGLPQILCYLGLRKRDRPDQMPLKIVGPADDVQKVVDLARAFLQAERFALAGAHVPDVFPVVPGESLETDAFLLETCGTVHAVQGLCGRFTDKTTGAVFGFTGDTAYHPPIADHLKGCPLIVHEASHGDRVVENARRTGHATAREAARIAQAAGAERLALVHMREEDAPQAVAAAREIFPGAFWPRDGETIFL